MTFIIACIISACIIALMPAPAEGQAIPTASPVGPADEVNFASGETIFSDDELLEFVEQLVVARGASNGLALLACPSPAPNVFGSPSWAQYVQFGQFLLRYFPECVGILSPALNPTAYRTETNGLYEPWDVSVTSFESWRNVADPGPPFGSEHGNRLHFGLAIVGDCLTQLTLADVEYNLTSSDGALDFAGTLVGTTLNGTSRVGVACGPDGLLGTPDDIVYSSGEDDTTLLDALFYIGVGNAYWPGAGNPDAGQDEIDEVVEYILAEDVSIDMTYTVMSWSTSVHLEVALFEDGFETGDLSEWSAFVN